MRQARIESRTGLDLPTTGPMPEQARAARRAVAFSGAGLSKESGLDTFRGPGGLWERMRPEELATPQAFARNPETVWSWYAWRWQQVAAAVPNPAHREIARWRDRFESLQVVTQNVDGLHLAAGSRDVLELHGTIAFARCQACARREPMAEAVARSAQEPPRCPACEGRMRPDVVWFGEHLPEGVFEAAAEAARSTDLFLAVGTSATVYPAAGLLEIAARAGALVIEVNVEPTPLSDLADVLLTGPAAEMVPALGRWLDGLG
jgi:NAD-dependent deacetylase